MPYIRKFAQLDSFLTLNTFHTYRPKIDHIVSINCLFNYNPEPITVAVTNIFKIIQVEYTVKIVFYRWNPSYLSMYFLGEVVSPWP